jgi:hypothetical protein
MNRVRPVRVGEARSAMGVADRDSAATYNYPRFDGYASAGGDLADEEAFRASAWPGQSTPDLTLLRLGDRAAVRLSDLWLSRPLVMEFGSFT